MITDINRNTDVMERLHHVEKMFSENAKKFEEEKKYFSELNQKIDIVENDYLKIKNKIEVVQKNTEVSEKKIYGFKNTLEKIQTVSPNIIVNPCTQPSSRSLVGRASFITRFFSWLRHIFSIIFGLKK